MQRTHAKQPKPQNQVTAADLVERLSAVRQLMGEIDQRGGILRVMDDALMAESSRKALVTGLEPSWKALRGYVIHIGDYRRAKGQAVPLCWISEEAS